MSEKLKILVVSPGMPHSGGAAMRAFRHAEYLNSSQDFEARLIAWNKGKAKVGENQLPNWMYPVQLFINDFRTGSPLCQVLKLFFHVSEITVRLGWYFLLNRKNYDLVHSIGSSDWFNLISIPIAKWMRRPVVTEMIGHGHDPLSLSRQTRMPKNQLFPHRPLKYQLFLMSDAYVSKSMALSQAYFEANLPQFRLYQIASAVDLEKFRPVIGMEEKKQLREQLDIDSNVKIILFVGRINHEKGVHWLLPAYRELLNYCPDTQLLLAGSVHESDLSYAKTWQQNVTDWGISNKVTFLGMMTNVSDYLRASDLFVLPSRNEGFSGAILEAMASQLPIVASDVPGISQSQIQNNVEGLLVPVGDVNALAAAMKILLNNPERANEMAHAARIRAEKMYSPQQIGAEYGKMYRPVIKKNR